MSALPASAVDQFVSQGGSYRRDVAATPAFQPGDKVRAKNIHPLTHTRLPRYARGKVGRVVAHRGAFVLPDANALQEGEAPQHVYCVCFSATELWGHDADARDENILELWEGYLEPAD